MDDKETRKQRVLNRLNSNTIITDVEARGDFGVPYDIVTEHTDEAGQQWHDENDNGGTLFERVKDGAMDIYQIGRAHV